MSRILYNLPLYTKWEEVPDHLKTRTQLNKAGLLVTPEQKPTAHIHTFFMGKKRGEYALYNQSEAVPKKALTDNQKAAIAKARETNRIKTTCVDCGKRSQEVRKHTARRCDECTIIRRTDEGQRRAFLWVKGLIGENNFLVIDVETTGLEAKDEVIEIAVYNAAGEALFNSLVKPTVRVNESAREVHHISDEMLATAPTLPEVEAELRAALSSAGRIVAYSDGFDHKKLNYSLQVWGLDPVGIFEDAQSQYAAYYGEWDYKRATFRRKRLEGGHRAADDCIALLQLLKIMATNEPYYFREAESK